MIHGIDSARTVRQRKDTFSAPTLCKLLCNTLIKPCFNHACSSCYPNLNRKLKQKNRSAQNNCMPLVSKNDSIFLRGSETLNG